MAFGSGMGGTVGSSTDIALNNPLNNDALFYNASTGKWQNRQFVLPDATTSVKGVVQLAGDLGGTAFSPTVPGLSSKANDSSVVHLAANETVTGIKTFSVAPSVPDASFTISKTSGLDGALNSKQTSNLDLTTIANLAPNNDDVLQRKSNVWTNRSPAQLKTDLNVTASDIGLNNVNNTSDSNKPISNATQTALNLKADATSVGTKTILITNAAALPNGTPAGVIVVVQS